VENTPVRKIDQLGRLMVPFDIRKKLGVEKLDSLMLKVEEGKLIIQKAKNQG
jgi:bifunctional DNA-binding transcriptional regulator/antitoxin component of YhaV-PrlF toxin-antitoxin module